MTEGLFHELGVHVDLAADDVEIATRPLLGERRGPSQVFEEFEVLGVVGTFDPAVLMGEKTFLSL